jgi:hypothetical protein
MRLWNALIFSLPMKSQARDARWHPETLVSCSARADLRAEFGGAARLGECPAYCHQRNQE